MADQRFSVTGALDLPGPDREVFLHLIRGGSLDLESIASALGKDEEFVEKSLSTLIDMGRVRVTDDGRYDVVLGRVTRRTTLPVQLWPALSTTDRFYSEQEIAMLRTAVPMLQFARAKLSEFTDHGPGHAFRVKSFATQLSYILGLNSTERHLLRAGALFHDIGNVVSRERHNIISQETVQKLVADGQLPYTRKEAEIVGLLCRWHRGEYEPDRIDRLRKEDIPTGHLASILRVADAMDIDHRRADYGQKFWKVLEFFFHDQIHHWTSLEQILGVRICCTPGVKLQIFTKGRTSENVQIDMLSGDLGSTPLGWEISEVSVDASGSAPEDPRVSARSALLVFPFEAHSLIMAALSRKHLAADGHNVEHLCYPDTPDGSAWLWNEELPILDAKDFDRIIIIGDRPDSSITSQILSVLQSWRDQDLAISIMNRHESNWSRIPKLLGMGVETILGGDWAYFWGDAVSEVDLIWGRIAALCTRDPTQSTVGVTAQERSIIHGLLNAVYDVLNCSPEEAIESWESIAEPLLSRIEADDRGYFCDRVGGFLETFSSADIQGTVDGRIVVFEQAPTTIPQAIYWILESTIENLGRAPERSIKFNTPYAITTWDDGEYVELLAMNHWREEEAIPIRLLYPQRLGPPPKGNESTIRVRMSEAQAKKVIRTLIERCSERYG